MLVMYKSYNQILDTQKQQHDQVLVPKKFLAYDKEKHWRGRREEEEN